MMKSQLAFTLLQRAEETAAVENETERPNSNLGEGPFFVGN